MTTPNKITAIAIASCAVVLVVSILLDEIKIKDPGDPRFNPLRFRFSDYSSTDWPKVVAKIFHVGADREFVESVLVGGAGATIWEIDENYVRYSKIIWHSVSSNSDSVWVLYDEKSQLIALKTNAGPNIFPERLLEAQQRAIMNERRRRGIMP